MPSFSPDGRYIAYGAEGNVFVRSFSDAGNQIQISADGGFGPVWRPDGRELFYRRGDEILAVAIRTANGHGPAINESVFW